MSYGAPPPPPPPPPAPGTPGAMGTPPSNHLVWAILTTIFCCLPFGIVSIVFAAQVNGKWAAGDLVGAQESSRKAKMWAIISAVVGVVVSILYGIVVFALGDTSSTM